MIISEVQHIISALEKVLPNSFVFVLDTTDRSFLYKSQNRQECLDRIVQLDQESGIDKLTRNTEFYTCEYGDYALFLKKIELNIFLGACMFFGEHSSNQLKEARAIICG